jgi:hypothetical protein
MASLVDSYYAWADVAGFQILEWAADTKFLNGKGQEIFPRPTKVSMTKICSFVSDVTQSWFSR